MGIGSPQTTTESVDATAGGQDQGPSNPVDLWFEPRDIYATTDDLAHSLGVFDNRFSYRYVFNQSAN